MVPGQEKKTNVGWERPPSFVRPVKAGKGGNKHKHTSHLAPLGFASISRRRAGLQLEVIVRPL